MTRVGVGFHGFWPGFRREDFAARHPYLLDRWELVESRRPEVVFYSVFADAVPAPTHDHVRVFYTGECGEPDLDAFDFAFSFCRIDDPRHLRLPNWLGRLRQLGFRPEDLVRNGPPPPRAAGFCSFLNGKHVPYREQLAESIATIGRVDSPGRNLPPIGPTFADKAAFLGGYRFSIACERELAHGYVSEKLVEAALLRTVPIYLGAPDVALDFDPASFVNRADFEDEASFLARISDIDRDPELYEEIRSRPFLHGNRVPAAFADETVSAFFDRIFTAAASLAVPTVSRRRAPQDPLEPADDEDALSSRLDVSGRFLALAFADELVADPSLLAEYSRSFDASTDATLAIWAPNREAEEVVAELGSQAEIDADLLLLPLPDSAAADVAARVDCLYSRRVSEGPFAGRPSTADLRTLRRLARTSDPFLEPWLLAEQPPWSSEALPADDVPGMITPEERRYFRWIGARYTGAGAAVELGPWLGCSTRHIVAGLQRSAAWAGQKLHVYDDFVWRSSWMDSYYEGSDRPAEHGNFKPIFDRLTAPIAAEITVRKVKFADYDGNRHLPSLVWSGDPVEVIYVDCGRTMEANEAWWQVFAPYFVPGVTLVVMQDWQLYKEEPKQWYNQTKDFTDTKGDALELVHELRDGAVGTFLFHGDPALPVATPVAKPSLVTDSYKQIRVPEAAKPPLVTDSYKPSAAPASSPLALTLTFEHDAATASSDAVFERLSVGCGLDIYDADGAGPFAKEGFAAAASRGVRHWIALPGGTPARERRPPNYLLLTFDSCRFDVLQEADTPVLDSYAEIVRAQTPANFTYAAHQAFFVGMLPNAIEPLPYHNRFVNQLLGLGGRVGEIAVIEKACAHRVPSDVNLVVGLAEQGYQTVGAGAMNWFKQQSLTQWFERFVYTGTDADAQIDFLLEHVDPTRPFFGFVNFGETHDPFDFAGKPDRCPIEVQSRLIEWPPAQNGVPVGRECEAWQHQRRSAEFLDSRLPRLFDALPGNTIVILCGDHGEAMGEDGYWGHGVNHPTVLEVPLAIFRLDRRPL